MICRELDGDQQGMRLLQAADFVEEEGVCRLGILCTCDCDAGRSCNRRCFAKTAAHGRRDHFGAYVDQVTIPDPVEPSLRQRMNYAGMDGYYKYAVMTPAERGLALVGTYFEQARIGFIHEPLVQDDPEKVEARDQNEFQAILASRSKPWGDYVSERHSILGNATVDELVDEIERGRNNPSIE